MKNPGFFFPAPCLYRAGRRIPGFLNFLLAILEQRTQKSRAELSIESGRGKGRSVWCDEGKSSEDTMGFEDTLGIEGLRRSAIQEERAEVSL